MPKRILIADDSAPVRRAMRAMLEGANEWAVCAEAEDGRQAVMKAAQVTPDLIVIDLSMPLMNGLDAAHELRAILPSVPIVMYTGFEVVNLEQLARSAGINAVVPKSAPETLMSTVRSLLNAA